MVWIYSQSTGELRHNGELVGTGYAGVYTNKNNPDRQQVKDMGPLPRGKYTIQPDNGRMGPLSLKLVPQSTNNMQGRAGFYIHGDKSRPGAILGFASEGCIVINRTARHSIARSGGNQLEVIR